MKYLRTALAALAVGFGFSAHGAGAYDGVWSASFNGTQVGYFSLHQNGSTVVAAWMPLLGDRTDTWEAFMGNLNGSSSTVSAIAGGVNATYNVVFTGGSTASITQVSCTPKTSRDVCRFTNGSVLSANRIF